MQRGERRRSGRLHRVGDGDEAGERAVDRDRHHRLAGVAAGVGLRAEAGRRCRARPSSGRCRARPRGRRRGRARPGRSAPRSRRSARAPCRAPRRRGRSPRRAGARSRARGWRRGAAPRASSWPGAGSTAASSGLPRVSVPVLSTTSVSTAAKVSSASASRTSTPGLRAAPGGRHDRDRRREAERAGAGDDQHRDRRDQRVGERRRRAPDRPGDEGEHGDGDHRRHEPAGDRVGDALDRRARALRRGDHLDDAGEQRVAADAASPR